jgi:hypothetical protein
MIISFRTGNTIVKSFQRFYYSIFTYLDREFTVENW